MSGRRRRRTHAERAAETRARILDAAVESIAEVGFQRTTAAEITRRAGVTWGAVQHHFGGKDGMFLAVLDDSFRRFEGRLADLPVGEADLEKRVSLFLEGAWAHFASPHYRSTFEILLNHLGRAEPEPDAWQLPMLRAWDRVWMRMLGDAPVPRRRHRLLQHYTVAVLSGLASSLVLEGPDARPRPGEIELLRDTLTRELIGSSAG